MRPDHDAIEALSSEREALWARVDKATFLTPNEKRAAVGYGPAAGGDEIKKVADQLDGNAVGDLSYKYPGQPRTALGQFDFGKNPDGAQPAQDRRRAGYPVDIREEDALGGHTFARHVNKPDEYLKARILENRVNIPFIGGVGEKRAGSFTSLEAANKLVNSTLSQNQEKIDAFVQGRFPLSLPFMYVHADFNSPTGYEAYAPNDRSQPTMRTTYGVTALVIRTDRSEKGYYVLKAYPVNRD